MNTLCTKLTRRRGVRAGLSAALALAGLSAAFGAECRAGVPLGPLAAGAVGQAGFGTIKGRLVWGGSEAPPKRNLVDKGKADKDPAVCAATEAIPDNSLLVDPKTKGIKFGFVYLVKPTGENPEAVKAALAKAASVVVDQKNCEFIPFATAVVKDQPVVFKSSDPVNHNVNVQPFTNEPFNTILPPNGEITKKFEPERRVIPLKCDIHPWMKGYLMVFDHPFFAVTGEDGSFEIKGVPAGTQNLVVWHDSGFVTPGLAKGTPVTVTADKVSDIGDVKLDPSKVKR